MREALYILLLVLLACALFAILSRARYRKLTRRRTEAGGSFETFRDELRDRGSDPVLRIVYEHFSAMTGTGMPVRASDDLGKIYGIVDDDVPDELNDLADQCGVPRPRPEEAYRVQTVADAVVLIESLRRRVGPAP